MRRKAGILWLFLCKQVELEESLPSSYVSAKTTVICLLSVKPAISTFWIPPSPLSLWHWNVFNSCLIPVYDKVKWYCSHFYNCLYGKQKLAFHLLKVLNHQLGLCCCFCLTKFILQQNSFHPRNTLPNFFFKEMWPSFHSNDNGCWCRS